MSATISINHDKLLDELLTAGRFRNKSEIIRRGLELVKKEIQAETLQPLTAAELRAAYQQMSAADHQNDAAMSNASALPVEGEL